MVSTDLVHKADSYFNHLALSINGKAREWNTHESILGKCSLFAGRLVTPVIFRLALRVLPTQSEVCGFGRRETLAFFLRNFL